MSPGEVKIGSEQIGTKRRMAGMNVNQESIREMLTCAICMEEFRSPRSLPCLHTFCQSCLGDYLVRKHVRPGSTFPCPTCRESVVLPKQGVAGLRSNFLIKNMLGLLEAQAGALEQDVPDLMAQDELVDATSAGSSSPTDAAGDKKRISQTQLLMYQAKEEKLKLTLKKAEKHAKLLKEHKSNMESSVQEMKRAKEKLLNSLDERFEVMADEMQKYKAELLDKIKEEMDVEKDSQTFNEEAALTAEDLSTLDNIVQFAEDVLSSGSLETVAAITDDVVKNVSKIIRKEFKHLEWKTYEFEVPQNEPKDQVRQAVGALKQVSLACVQCKNSPDPEVPSSLSLSDLEGESSVTSVKSPATTSQPLSIPSVHDESDNVRIYPRYLADEFLFSSPEEPEVRPDDNWRGSPLALAGFDDAPRESPPIPARSHDNVIPLDDLVSVDTEEQTAAEGGQDARPDDSTAQQRCSRDSKPKQRKTISKSKQKPKIVRVALKLPPAIITAELTGSRPTGLDTIHDIGITRDGDICLLGTISTKDTTYQSIAIFKATGLPRFCKKLIPYEPSYPSQNSFDLLSYKGVESVALPLPEDSRIRIIPIEDTHNTDVVRTVYYKFRNMLYRPAHVFNHKDKLWAMGLDSFGRDSYDSKNKFDEWHPQCRVWDIATAESTEDSVKPDTAFLPCSTHPTCAKIDPASSVLYVAEKETVSAVHLTGDNGSTLMWKFGETTKKKQKLKQAQSVCVDAAYGRLYVACQGGDKVVALSTQGQFLQTVISDKQGLRKPTAVALDVTGQLVVGQANGDLKVFKLTT